MALLPARVLQETRNTTESSSHGNDGVDLAANGIVWPRSIPRVSGSGDVAKSRGQHASRKIGTVNRQNPCNAEVNSKAERSQTAFVRRSRTDVSLTPADPTFVAVVGARFILEDGSDHPPRERIGNGLSVALYWGPHL